VDEKLFVWIIMRSIRMIVKHGDVEYATFFYGGYANLLTIAFKDFENAYRYGRLSIDHLEKYDNILFKGNVYMNFGGSTSYLKDSYDRCIYYLHQTQHNSIPNSLHDLYNATAAGYVLIYMLLQGSNIADIKREYEEQRKYLVSTNNRIAQVYANELLNWLNVLQNESSRINWDYQVSNQTRVSFWESHLLLRLQMSYLLCEQDQTNRIIQKLKLVLKDSNIRPERPVFYFYRALSAFREMDNSKNKGKKQRLLKDVKHCIKHLRKFAACGPTNFEHLLMLIEAMNFRYTKQTDRAMLYFDRAIQLARLANNPRDEAIAQLNAAQFYFALGEPVKASDYMHRALELLYHWGAPYVVNIWSVRFHYLLQHEQVIEGEHATQPFNIAPIVSMYQMIAQEANETKLAKTALEEMMTHLDANEIYLLKVNGDKYYPIASANNDKGEFHYNEEKQVLLPHIIERELVEQVLTTKSYVIQNDVNAKQKSVIALSIFNKGQITAIVYATNYVLSSIFTKSKIDIVTILATQFLIALENIERQQQLELEVAERTQQLSQLNEQLQGMNAQLLQSEQERKYFLQHISHDLRSPLTSVIGYVEALESGMVKSEEKKLQYLQRSKVRLMSLQHLIKDLFDMTQLEGGRLDFQFEQMPVTQFLAIVEELLQQELSTDKLQFESHFKLHSDTGFVQIDLDRMMQVVQNLTSNINKYANTGVVYAHFIVMNSTLSITISDQGIGIPMKDLPFIFDMHFIASNHSRKEAHGIGMAICKRIIELHDGKIDVSSTEGKGTTFTIELPIVE
ncbi:MAG: ATP-binding protein, partial [Lysinibacillus sp.]